MQDQSDRTAPLLSPDQAEHLRYLAENHRKVAIRRRARILLAYQEGGDTQAVSNKIGLSPKTVRHWRHEFLSKGMGIFPDHALNVAVYLAPGDERSAGEAALPEAAPAEKAELPFPTPGESPGIQPMDPMAEAGRKTLCFHFAVMLGREAGTLMGEDPEELHDMRVATRRMRAAFRIFGGYFKPKGVKSFEKGLKTLGGVLGEARDMDVLLKKTQDYLDTLPENERPGLSPLLAAWGQDRDAAHLRLAEALSSPEYLSFKRKFNVFVQTPGKGVAPVSTNPPQPNLVRDVVPLIIYERLTSVRSFETILESASLEQLHRLRIEFKKLRYAIEFFREVLGEEAKSVINQLKDVQDHLGDLNDARVACQLIDQFLVDWEIHQSTLPLAERLSPQPIITFLGVRLAERHALMMSFPQTWEKFNSPDFRQKLALAVASL